MGLYLKYLFYISTLLFLGCNIAIDTPTALSGKTVELIAKDGKYQLYRNGEPYYIKGGSGTTHLKLLKEIGGNSFRTYTTENAQALLDSAHQLGLTVMLGIWIDPHSRHNDLLDSNFRKRTLRYIEREVNRYKDHPALLIWGIGNEVHPKHYNISSWEFLTEACKLVKKLDPNHPVTTSIAGYPRKNVPFMNMFLKNVDFVSFNTFGGIDAFEEKMKNPIWGYDAPYILSEWGFNGYWSTKHTKWHSPIEPASSAKAARFSTIWNKYITADDRSLGGYVFFWGQKQEYTNSWYSLFSPLQEKTLIVDSLASIWKGKRVKNFSPTIQSVNWINQPDISNIRVDTSSIHTLQLQLVDPENDRLSITVSIKHETSLNVDDFGIEAEPLEVKNSLLEIQQNTISFKAPHVPGIYRIYVKVSDNKGSCDMLNLPFLVTH